MGIRRNSPSHLQLGKGNGKVNESSPFESSPFSPAASTRMFWQGRDSGSPVRPTSENQDPLGRRDSLLSPSKRSSIENLKRASRVKNSAIFAREQKNEYDPNNVTLLDRPLASGRPLNAQVQSNVFGGRGVGGYQHSQSSEQGSDSLVKDGLRESVQSCGDVTPRFPSKDQPSPTKSSMSKRAQAHAKAMGFDPENGTWSDDDDGKNQRELPGGRVLRRHAKSVTFDQAPPQVNEYEMTTPDPSSVASGSREGSYDSAEDEMEESFERGSSLEREDSFDASLEDTDKTPVVLPEDWKFMTPEKAAATHELAQHEEDPFDESYGSPEPTAQPGMTDYRPHQTSVNSVDSNGQPRPLPPLPPMSSPRLPDSPSSNSLSETVERVSSSRRMLPSPPPPSSVSKNDIRRMSGTSMSLEDRLRLMMLQDQDKQKQEQRERRMRRANSKEPSPTHDNVNDTFDLTEAVVEDSYATEEVASPPRISRESILKRIRSQQDLELDDENEMSDIPSSSPQRPLPLDPDIPIPSRENDHDATMTVDMSFEAHVTIKQEPVDDEDETDLDAIPEYYRTQLGENLDDDDDDTSQYSRPSAEAQLPELKKPVLSSNDEQDTPRANSPVHNETLPADGANQASLAGFANFGLGDTFELGLKSYMTPSPPAEAMVKPQKPIEKDYSIEETSTRPLTPQLRPDLASNSRLEDDVSEPGTPDSVIRRPYSPTPPSEDLKVPDSLATVKNTGGKLKTRPSLTPADIDSMKETRRRVSDQGTTSETDKRPSSEGSFASKTSNNSSLQPSIVEESLGTSRNSAFMQLDLPRDDYGDGLGGLGLDKEFDRVIENQKVQFERSLDHLYFPSRTRMGSGNESPEYAKLTSASRQEGKGFGALAQAGAEFIPGQAFTPNYDSMNANRGPMKQRGYLMRQNTKVVVASNHAGEERSGIPTSIAEAQAAAAKAPSPTSPTRKASQQTWTTEPWNGKVRRKSIKMAGGSPRKKVVDAGPVPPLPGQTSNVQESQMETVEEDQHDDLEDGAERGRLFVKVVGVKDLDLPLPRNERTQFALTLDNGLHCVTTAWLELGRNAPIGQEFELVVLNDLEFQLTLQMKMEEPKETRPTSPSKAPISPTKKTSTWGKVFGSPKKRKELEAKVAQEAKRSSSPVKKEPTAYELAQGIVARDGSFARAYVALSEHESNCFGRPYSVDITAFNEWAMEEVSSFRGSNRSKKGNEQTTLQRRPPYRIGKLELQLLYVPKPKGAKEEEMPKSMAGAVRELARAEELSARSYEGHLSQQGGDCPFWRRRFFSLSGTKLTAYHEATHQPRATINLAKAAKLIDDKSALIQKETSARGGGRRKSAFAEEEEGYMFVEEGFRIRFANGEVIDFYADDRTSKEGWMKVLGEIVGKGASSTTTTSTARINAWAEKVLKRERSLKERVLRKQRVPSDKSKGHAQAQGQTAVRTGSGGSAKTGPEFASRDFATNPSPRKGSKDRPTSPTKGTIDPAQWVASSKALPPVEKSPQKSPQKQQSPQRPGHARTESHLGHGGLSGKAASPVKGKDSRMDRPKSMILDGRFY
ncbi:MAG: hypothetical protein Q9227_003198 [Pyrenula ochraceoflavens]